MAWAKGTAAAHKSKTEVKAHIEARAASVDYNGQLAGIRFAIGVDTDPRERGVKRVVLTSEADEQTPWQYPDDETGKLIQEEYHRLTIGILVDELSGANRKGEAAPTDAVIFSAIQCMLTAPAERELLAGRGVYNIRPIPEAQEVEGLEFRRAFAVGYSTDVFLT